MPILTDAGLNDCNGDNEHKRVIVLSKVIILIYTFSKAYGSSCKVSTNKFILSLKFCRIPLLSEDEVFIRIYIGNLLIFSILNGDCKT